MQYKLRGTFDETPYSFGVYVSDDGRLAPMTYTAIQDELNSGVEYSFRILASVKVGNQWYYKLELASPVVSTRTRAVGKR